MLTLDLPFNFCSSRSKLPVSSSMLQETFWGNITSILNPFQRRLNKQIHVEHCTLLPPANIFRLLPYPHSYMLAPNTKKQNLPRTPQWPQRLDSQKMLYQTSHSANTLQESQRKQKPRNKTHIKQRLKSEISTITYNHLIPTYLDVGHKNCATREMSMRLTCQSMLKPQKSQIFETSGSRAYSLPVSMPAWLLLP